jgi:hypothetical protein
MAILTKKRNVCKSKSKKKYRSRTRKNKSINKKKMRGGSSGNYNDLYAFTNPNFISSGYVQPTQNLRSGYTEANYGYSTIPSPSGYNHLNKRKTNTGYVQITPENQFIPTFKGNPLFTRKVSNLVTSKGTDLITGKHSSINGNNFFKYKYSS